MRTLSGCGTKRPRGAVLSRRLAILIAIFFATNLVASAQFIPSRGPTKSSQMALLSRRYELERPSFRSLFVPLKSQTLKAPYLPITPRQSLRWFTTNTLDWPTLAGEVFLSALGTAPNRPKEYGPHWGGFGDRYGMGVTRSATGNALEAGVGLILREDPRYFRVPDRPFKARVGNVIRLTFAARGHAGSFGPAYARYMAFFGTNFLSNTWRVRSEANAHDAFLRASEGFGGLMAANAFEEFWPDIKKCIFLKRH